MCILYVVPCTCGLVVVILGSVVLLPVLPGLCLARSLSQFNALVYIDIDTLTCLDIDTAQSQDRRGEQIHA